MKHIFQEGYVKVKPFKKFPYIGLVSYIKNQYWVVREITSIEWDGDEILVIVILQNLVEKNGKEIDKELKEAKKSKLKVLEFKGI